VRLEGDAIDKLYAERVKVVVVDPSGNEVAGKTEADVKAEQDAAKKEKREPALLAVYERIDDGKPVRYGIPLKGVGLWGPIGGFLAVDRDGVTITGATFTAPKETPGLGAEIQATPFTSQWAGKKLLEDGKTVPVDVVKGKAAELCPDRLEHCVDGISGATITARGVDVMVEAATATYDPFLLKIRQGG
jgi:Na+-transporting NADH:ubiquinone oxidoreductase subunit C